MRFKSMPMSFSLQAFTMNLSPKLSLSAKFGFHPNNLLMAETAVYSADWNKNRVFLEFDSIVTLGENIYVTLDAWLLCMSHCHFPINPFRQSRPRRHLEIERLRLSRFIHYPICLLSMSISIYLTPWQNTWKQLQSLEARKKRSGAPSSFTRNFQWFQ